MAFSEYMNFIIIIAASCNVTSTRMVALWNGRYPPTITLFLLYSLRVQMHCLVVSNFQNEFMKSSQNMNPKNYKDFCPVGWHCTGQKSLTIFGSYFGRNDDFINSFCNLLAFMQYIALGFSIPLPNPKLRIS